MLESKVRYDILSSDSSTSSSSNASTEAGTKNLREIPIKIQMTKKVKNGASVPPIWYNIEPITGPRLKPIPADVSIHPTTKLTLFGYVRVKIA